MRVLFFAKDKNLLYKLDQLYDVDVIKEETDLQENLVKNIHHIAIIDLDLLEDFNSLIFNMDRFHRSFRLIFITKDVSNIDNTTIKYVDDFIIKPYSVEQVIARLNLNIDKRIKSEPKIDNLTDIIFTEINKEMQKLELQKKIQLTKLHWELLFLRFLVADVFIDARDVFKAIKLSQQMLLEDGITATIFLEENLDFTKFTSEINKQICIVIMSFLRACSVSRTIKIKMYVKKENIYLECNSFAFLDKNTTGNLFFSLMKKKVNINVIIEGGEITLWFKLNDHAAGAVVDKLPFAK